MREWRAVEKARYEAGRRRPNVGRALAEAYGTLKTLRSEARRARRRLTVAHGGDQIRQRSVALDEVAEGIAAEEAYIERLLTANAAHVLTWAHVEHECLICQGEVTL